MINLLKSNKSYLYLMFDDDNTHKASNIINGLTVFYPGTRELTGCPLTVTAGTSCTVPRVKNVSLALQFEVNVTKSSATIVV